MKPMPTSLDLTKMRAVNLTQSRKFALRETKFMPFKPNLKPKPLLSIGHVRRLIQVDASLAFANPCARVAVRMSDPT